MDGNKSTKKSPRSNHSPRMHSFSKDKKDDESVANTEPNHPPPPPVKVVSASRLANRLKGKDLLDSNGKPPLINTHSSQKLDSLSRHGSNKSFNNGNEVNNDTLKNLVKKSESTETMLAVLLKEVRELSASVSKAQEGIGADRSINQEVGDAERDGSNTSNETSISGNSNKWVRVFSNSSHRYFQINTSTGDVLDECEVVGNGWEVFRLPDREMKIWVEPGGKRAVFKPPAFLEAISSPTAVDEETSGGSRADSFNRGGPSGGGSNNAIGSMSMDSGFGSLDGENPSERFRVLLTPRTSAAQARALAMQAATKEISKLSQRNKSQGYWDIAKNSIKSLLNKRINSGQTEQTDEASMRSSREVSQGFLELQTRLQSGEEELPEMTAGAGSGKARPGGPRRPQLSRRISLGMGKVNHDASGSGKGKVKTTVINEHGEVEEIRTVKQSQVGWLMLNPDGTVRMTWDIMIIVPFLIFLATMTPFFLCFGYDPSRRHNPHLLLFEAIVDAAFLFDIFLSFRTGYLTLENEVEYDSKLVALHYLKGWFFIDFVSGFPYSIILLTDTLSSDGWLSSVKVLKVSKMLRALRVVRFFKLTRMLKTTKLFNIYLDPQTREWFEDFLSKYGGSIQVKFIQVVFLLALLCHYMGCFWVLVAREGSRKNHETWLSDGTVVDNFTYRSTKSGPDVGSIYIAAFYYCMTTMTSVGYGDLHPLTDRERIFTIFLEGIGCVMYALVVATLTSVIMSKDANARAMSEKLENIRSYITHRGFTPVLARKLRAYFRHFYNQKMAIDEMQILKDCSTGLRMEVSSFLVSNLMDKVSLFRMLPPVYWARMLPILRPCLFNAGEVICTQGEETSDMFIILSGACRAFTTGLKEHLNDVIHLESQHADCNLLASNAKKSTNHSPPRDRSPPKPLTIDEQLRRINKEDAEDATSTNNRAVKRNSRNKDRFIFHEEPEARVNRSIDQGTHEEDMEAFEMARFVVAGGVLNSLAALGVWPQCVESVVALEVTEAYVVNADDMSALFKDDRRLWDSMRRRAVVTGFAMVPDPEAPTEYGMPVHVLPAEETAEKEASFEVKLMEESKKRWVAMERRKSGALALSSRAMMNSRNSSSSILHVANQRPSHPSNDGHKGVVHSPSDIAEGDGEDDDEVREFNKPRSRSVNGGGDWEESNN